MGRCILDSTFELVRIFQLFGVEAVKEAIEVLKELGSRQIVSLTLAYKALYVWQSLDSNRNGVTEDLCGEPNLQGGKWRQMDMLLL